MRRFRRLGSYCGGKHTPGAKAQLMDIAVRPKDEAVGHLEARQPQIPFGDDKQES